MVRVFNLNIFFLNSSDAIQIKISSTVHSKTLPCEGDYCALTEVSDREVPELLIY